MSNSEYYKDVELEWVRRDDGTLSAPIWDPSFNRQNYTIKGYRWSNDPEMSTWMVFEHRRGLDCFGEPNKTVVYECASTGDETSTIAAFNKHLTVQRKKWAWEAYMATHWPPE